jgi:hypothetical protein
MMLAGLHLASFNLMAYGLSQTTPTASTWSNSGQYYTFSSGDPVSSTQINSNFSQLFNQLQNSAAQLATILGGTLTSSGALNLNAGGTSQNITLTPSGSGYTILNGNVGIGVTTPTSTLQVDGSLATNTRTISVTPYTLAATDSVVFVNAATIGSSVNVYLPAVANCVGRQYTIKRTDAPAYTVSSTSTTLNYTVTIYPAAASGTLIDGQSQLYLPTQYSYYTLASDGTAWNVIGAFSTILSVASAQTSGGANAYCPTGMVVTGGACNCAGAPPTKDTFYNSGNSAYYNCSEGFYNDATTGCANIITTAFCGLEY